LQLLGGTAALQRSQDQELDRVPSAKKSKASKKKDRKAAKQKPLPEAVAGRADLKQEGRAEVAEDTDIADGKDVSKSLGDEWDNSSNREDESDLESLGNEHCTCAEEVHDDQEFMHSFLDDSAWQEVSHRRRSKKQGHSEHSETCEAGSDDMREQQECSGGQNRAPFEESFILNADLWRHSTPVSYLCTDLDELTDLEKMIRSWRESILKIGPSNDQKGPRTPACEWHQRRKENAAWRVWFMAQGKGGNHALPGFVNDLAPSSCVACARGENIGMVCSCCMQLLDRSSGYQESDGDSSSSPASQSTLTPNAKDTRWMADMDGTDTLLAECFASPLILDEDTDTGQEQLVAPDWQYLFRRHMPNVVATAGYSVRSQNAFWTKWISAYKLGEARQESHGPNLIFPATPTSSAPGSPRLENTAVDLGQMVPVVNFQVPLHIAPQVHAYIQKLLEGGE